MNRKYECVFFFNPELDEESLSLELQEVEKLIAKGGGSVITKSQPKVLDMGYHIKNKKNGYYVLVDFETDPQDIANLKRVLRLKDNILRYTIIAKKEDKVSL